MISFLPQIAALLRRLELPLEKRGQSVIYRHCLLVLFCWTILTPSVYADSSKESDPISAAQKVEKANLLLKRTCDFYRNLDSFSGRVTTEQRQHQPNDKPIRSVHAASIAFRRNGYLKIKMHHPKDLGEVIVTDLDAHFSYPRWHMFVNRVLPTLDQVFSDPDFGFMTEGSLSSSWILRALVSADPYAEVLKGWTVADYNGISTVDGEKCHQVTMNGTNGAAAHIWLSAGDKPWIQQFAYDMSPSRMKVKTVYRSMKANPDFREKQCKSPARAKQVTHFSSSDGDSGARLLVGQAAPKLNLRTADGGKFTLSKQRGKVVVLEFWATWCGPCCRALPILADVTSSFPKRDVEFLAINKGETSAKINSFLNDKSLPIKVGLDQNGEICQRYRVGGIPHTVVIGRNGKIRSVKIGIGPYLQQNMTKEIEEAVAQSQ